jgi:hypothetical protein
MTPQATKCRVSTELPIRAARVADSAPRTRIQIHDIGPRWSAHRTLLRRHTECAATNPGTHPEPAVWRGSTDQTAPTESVFCARRPHTNRVPERTPEAALPGSTKRRERDTLRHLGDMPMSL